MIPHNLPDYVDRGGRQVWRPPYRATNAEVFGFVLGCDPTAIDSLLQRDLVEPAGGAFDYRCAQPRIVVLFAAIERLTSGDSRDSLRGYIPELEVGVWCLAADVTAGGRLTWYLPYVFVDSGQAVASGREVYGYPKQMAVMESGYPGTLANAGQTTVSGLAIQQYGPNAEAVLRPMIGAERLPPQPGAPALGDGLADEFADLVALFGAGLAVDELLPFGSGPRPTAAIGPIGSPPPPAMPVAPPPWAARRVLDTFLGRGLATDSSALIGELVANPTLVFLKQFRDVSCPTKACYQAVVEAPLAVDPLTAKYEALDPSLFEITVQDWDSHPIASDVGVVPRTPLQPEVAFHATFDFDIQLGLELWRAPT